MKTVKDLFDVISLPPHQLMELSTVSWTSSKAKTDCMLVPNIINCAVYNYKLGHTILAITADNDRQHLYINDLMVGIPTMIAPNAIKCSIDETIDDVCAYLLKTTGRYEIMTDVFECINDIINMYYRCFKYTRSDFNI